MMRMRFRLTILVSLTIGLFSSIGEPGELASNVGIMIVRAMSADRLKIPAIKVDLRIVTARFSGDTWDFSAITYQAAYLEGRSLPGSGGNVAIGAHSELAARAPGPFYKLDSLNVGDEIDVSHKGVEYRYRVQGKWSVLPTDLTPIIQTESEVLTLLTCEGYVSATDSYSLRLIVRAVPILPYVKPPPE